jgi:hypothetical protein
LLKIFLGLCHQATKIAREFHISPEDVYTYNDLERSKAAGPDGIPNCENST